MLGAALDPDPPLGRAKEEASVSVKWATAHLAAMRLKISPTAMGRGLPFAFVRASSLAEAQIDMISWGSSPQSR